MKKIIYLAMILTLVLFSCRSKEVYFEPVAFFSTDNAEPSVGQEVFFLNESQYGVRFEWDFGDGYISDAENPSHIFTGTGTYEVMLTVYSNNGLSDKATMTIVVLIPTLLEIEVLEFYDEYSVEDASIILYSTVIDWDNQTNIVSEGFTDADGIAVFSNLDPFVYYVDIWEATHDNYGLKAEDIGFIRTPEILPHKINRFIAYVDYVVHGKGARTGEKTYVIKKLVRKAADKEQPAIVTGTEGWQELYNKSIKLK